VLADFEMDRVTAIMLEASHSHVDSRALEVHYRLVNCGSSSQMVCVAEIKCSPSRNKVLMTTVLKGGISDK